MSVPLDEVRRIVQIADRYTESLNELIAAMQELDRRDPRMMAILRQKYCIPQMLSRTFDLLGEYMAATKPFLESQ